MSFRSLVLRWLTSRRPNPVQPPARRRGVSLALEALEDRVMPAVYTAASVSDLVADINAANAAGGANTIVLAPHTTFTLTAADNTTDGGNGLPVIAGNDNLTILGNHDTIARSQDAGTAAFRLFEVAGGASLTLKNLTLQNGLAVDDTYSGGGGAISNLGTLVVDHCTVSNNMKGEGDGYGGGIVNLGLATITASTISDNSASYGGGIDNEGTLTVGDSTISGNSAPDGVGGAIRNFGVLTLDRSTLSDNTATNGGGAVYNSGTLTINQSVLSDNSSSDGGGLYNDMGATATVVASSLTGNTAVYGDNGGGGIYNYLGILTLVGSTLSGNSTDAFGGALNNVGTATLDHCTLDGNSAGYGGGAIYYYYGTLTIDSCHLQGNSAPQGGGIYSLWTLVITNTALHDNSATDGGALFNGGTLTISGSTITGNSATDAGGGIYNDDGTLTLEDSTVVGNRSPDGGDLYNAGTTTAIDSRVGEVDNQGQYTTL